MGQKFYEVTTPDGKTEKYASVTTVISALPRPRELVEWMDKTPDASRHTRDRATIGSIIHWRINRFLSKKHKLPMQPLRLDCTIVTEEMKNTIDVIWSYFLDAEREIELVPVYLEKQVVNHELKYAGTLDYAGLANNEKAIIDFKTFKNLYGDHTAGAQLAAYKRGCDYKADKLFVLTLNEETGWNLIPISDDWEKFQEALKIYRERQKATSTKVSK